MSELAPVVLGVVLAVLGLSYLVQTELWLGLARRTMVSPQNLFPMAIGMIVMGVAVGYGFDDWNGSQAIFVSLLAWLLAAEGALVLLLPGLIRKLQCLSDSFLKTYLRFGGVVLVLLGGWLLKRTMI